jgi:signal transduction histidine kinase
MEAKGIEFKSAVDESFSGKQLSPEQRRNVYLIFKEAVNNAAKYAEATQVSMNLTIRRGILFLDIEDNGKGFLLSESGAASASGGGNGLNNMRQRATDIKGKLQIHTEPGKGTKVSLSVKL